jgi:small-conductance mechanosensitive channel
VLFWVADINITGELRSRVLAEIYKAISEQKVQLPSTQKDLYLHFPDGFPVVKQEAEKETGKKPLTEETNKTAPDPGQ